MKILYVAAKYDYGDPTRGHSFEHCNFYETLTHMGHNIIYFDFVTEYQQRGRAAMNARLLDIAIAEKPDLLFCVLIKDELDVDTMRRITQRTDTVTFNWFCDDRWRFDNFSRHWAPAFNWVSTTAASALVKYKRIGYANAIKTQWACNHYSYRRLDLEPQHDVTFVGQPHGNRRKVVATLRKAGIDVKAWGHGWEAGRLDQGEMIEVFNQSRINLNLSNASTRADWKRWSPWHHAQTSQQIKGRNFEIPGCGGFMLTGTAENLADYYMPDREIAMFTDADDLVRKVTFYLEHEQERQAIRDAGYQRTLTEHTYEKRFNDIFAAMGLCELTVTGNFPLVRGAEKAC